MKTNKIITAAIVGSIMGVLTFLVIEPMITKPVEKKVEEVLEK